MADQEEKTTASRRNPSAAGPANKNAAPSERQSRARIGSVKAADPASAPAAAPLEDSLSKPAVTELKEAIMETAPQADYSKFMSDAMTEMQSRARNAYEKSTEIVGEMTDLARGNAEAFAESGKILAGAMQDLGKSCVDEAKTAYETLTGDLKEMAAVRSPAELFQLQNRLMRRNLDMLVAYGTKNSETMLQLASDAFAPISGRFTTAAEKMSNAG